MIHQTVQAQRRKLLRKVSWWFGTFLTGYLIVISILLPGLSPAKMVAGFTICSLFAIGYFSIQPRFYRTCAIALVSICTLAAFGASLTNGGIEGYVTPVFIAGPVSAALFLSARASLVACVAVLFGMALQMVLDDLGLVSEPAYSDTALKFASFTLIAFTALVSTAALRLFAQSRDDLIDQLLTSNAAVAQAEAEARQLRDIADVQRKKAEQASEVKTEFLANMSHELRTPLNGVIGMAQLMEDTELDAVQKRYAMTIRSSGESLLHMINGLLDVSKIESGVADFNPTRYSPRALLKSASDSVSAIAQQKGLTLTHDVEDGVPHQLFGDPRLLTSVLVNLIGNAVKFTETGSIHVSLRLDRIKRLQFEVRDTGLGIDPDDQQAIFERYQQSDSASKTSYAGTGLGLSICRDLVDIMGGEFGVESQVGVGSTFWFAIPQMPWPDTADADEQQAWIRHSA